MRSNVLERRLETVRVDLAHSQMRLDALQESVRHEAGNIDNIAAMTFGAGLFRLSRAGSLSLGATQLFPGFNALSYLGSLGVEVTAYRGAQSFFQTLHGQETENIFNRDGWLRTFGDFFALKGTGILTKNTNAFFMHSAQAATMVASRRFNAWAGFIPASNLSLVEEFAEATSLNFAMHGGTRLFGLMSGSKMNALERSLDLQIQCRAQSAALSFAYPTEDASALLGMSAQGRGLLRKAAGVIGDKLRSGTTAVATSAVGPLVRAFLGEISRQVENGNGTHAQGKLAALRILLENTQVISEELRADIDRLEKRARDASPKNFSTNLTEEEAAVLLDNARQLLLDPRSLILGRSASALNLLGLLEFYSTELNHTLERGRIDLMTGLFNRNHLDNSIPKLERNLTEDSRRKISEDIEAEARLIENVESGSVIEEHLAERTHQMNEAYTREPFFRDWVLMLDIDRFKLVNDTYGHHNGDMALRHVAEIAQGSIRSIRGGGGDLAFRYGGEEMLIYLRDTDAAGVQAVAARIQSALAAQPITYVDKQGKVIITKSESVTIGAARIFPQLDNLGNITYQGAIIRAQKTADEALYAGKQAGRNRLVISTDSQ